MALLALSIFPLLTQTTGQNQLKEIQAPIQLEPLPQRQDLRLLLVRAEQGVAPESAVEVLLLLVVTVLLQQKVTAQCLLAMQVTALMAVLLGTQVGHFLLRAMLSCIPYL